MRKMLLSGKYGCSDRVQVPRGSEVAAERLLDHDPGAFRAAALGQVLDHHREQAGRDGQVVRRALRACELGADPREGGGIGVVAVHVPEPLRQPGEGRGVERRRVR